MRGRSGAWWVAMAVVGAGAVSVMSRTGDSAAQPVGRYVHLGHVLGPSTPIFPGDPPFSSELVKTIPADGYKLERISTGTHTGTHLSAPCHFIEGAACLDDLPPAMFMRLPAVVIDVRDRVRAQGGNFQLSLAEVQAFDRSVGYIPRRALVILFTGFQDRWGNTSYYEPAPGFGPEAVEWLARERAVAGLGSDTFGPDATSDAEFSASAAIFAYGGITIENLTGLDQLPPVGANITATPARLEDGSGFPVNPIAELAPTP